MSSFQPGERAVAASLGLATYATGRPCIRGNVAPRKIGDGNCLCAECAEHRRNVGRKGYRENGKERAAKWRAKNPDRQRQAMATWRANNPEMARAANRRNGASRRSTPAGKLANRINPAIRRWLRGSGGDKVAKSKLGYGREELILHLEKQFLRGMGWHNMGMWHIDHIVPLSSFDAQIESDFLRAWALSNLRPLWARENMKKKAKHVHLI